jgi:hypothetical protein
VDAMSDIFDFEFSYDLLDLHISYTELKHLDVWDKEGGISDDVVNYCLEKRKGKILIVGWTYSSLIVISQALIKKIKTRGEEEHVSNYVPTEIWFTFNDCEIQFVKIDLLNVMRGVRYDKVIFDYSCILKGLCDIKIELAKWDYLLSERWLDE